jgi:MATE family multidrug resistance protein
MFLFINTYRYFINRGVSVVSVLKEGGFLNIAEYLPFLKINGNIFIRSLCLLLTFNSFYIFSANYGKDVLAANTILMELGLFAAIFLDALANVTESFVARAYVSNNYDHFKDVIIKTLIQCLAITTVLVIIYVVFEHQIIFMMTSIPSVITEINKYTIFLILLPMFASISYWIDGVFVGMLKTVAMRNSMIVSSVIYVLLVFSLSSYNNYGLWWSLLLFYLARTISLLYPLNKYLKRKDNATHNLRNTKRI